MFIAMIIPLDGYSGGIPTHPIAPGGGGGLAPSHPIAPGGPPLGTWGGRPPNYVDIGGPSPQPRPPQSPPPGFWGGSGVGDYIDAGGPGPQPGGPIYIWGGIGDYIDAGFPAPQPPLPPTINDRPVDWKVAWSPATGWIVVGIPTGPVVTPSK
jgi:hypothetical protein